MCGKWRYFAKSPTILVLFRALVRVDIFVSPSFLLFIRSLSSLPIMEKLAPVVENKISYYKLFRTSALGTFVGYVGFVLVIILFAAIANWFSHSGATVERNSILKLTFDGAIPEQTNNVSSRGDNPFDNSEMPGLRDIVRALDKAKTDDRIKGIYLELKGPSAGFATRTVLRNALLDFRKSGKFVLSYADGYTQGEYYLATAADKVYLNPHGSLEWVGYAAKIPYFKNMLDKIGVVAQVYYAGKFKSATESFRRTDMSPENRIQVREYIEDIYGIYLADIAASRKKDPAELRHLADAYAIRQPSDALHYGLIDGMRYKDEMLDDLRTRLKLKPKDRISAVTLDEYIKDLPASEGKGRDKIAVVYAEGNITDGEGGEGSIGGDKYAATIRKLREKDDVKAIVVRVNSGGGSALASELIWRELELAKKAGKKVVVSMGDVAASGGYYIAAGADRIFAEPNTITGSIGVFGMIPNAEGLMKDKLGITFDTVRTTRYSAAGGYYRYSEEEGKIIQEMIDTIYDEFLTRVAVGRKMAKPAVNDIAQGRVWTGKKALALGLVDEMGGLDAAIAYAAKEAKLTTYKLTTYPTVPSKMEQFVEMLKGGKDDDKGNRVQVMVEMELKRQLGTDLYQQYRQIRELQTLRGAQMRLPYLINVE